MLSELELRSRMDTVLRNDEPSLAPESDNEYGSTLLVRYISLSKDVITKFLLLSETLNYRGFEQKVLLRATNPQPPTSDNETEKVQKKRERRRGRPKLCMETGEELSPKSSHEFMVLRSKKREG